MRYKQKMLMVISLGTILAAIITLGLFDAKGYFKKHEKTSPVKVYVSAGYEIHGYGDTIEIYYNKILNTVLVADYSVEFISIDSLTKPVTNMNYFENERLTTISLSEPVQELPVISDSMSERSRKMINDLIKAGIKTVVCK